jgi:hypothetical protein
MQRRDSALGSKPTVDFSDAETIVADGTILERWGKIIQKVPVKKQTQKRMDTNSLNKSRP